MMVLTYERALLVLAGLLGVTAIAAGAAGAHALHDPAMQALVEKASFYQLIHAVALLVLLPREGYAARVATLSWLVGVVCFSGSLYLKAFGLTAGAPLAPAGGILLMLGWLALVFSLPGRRVE